MRPKVERLLFGLSSLALSCGATVVLMLFRLPTYMELFLVFVPLMWKARKGHRSMLTLYAFACLVLDYSLSWLLSAGRYLSCALPFFFFAAWSTAFITSG